MTRTYLFDRGLLKDFDFRGKIKKRKEWECGAEELIYLAHYFKLYPDLQKSDLQKSDLQKSDLQKYDLQNSDIFNTYEIVKKLNTNVVLKKFKESKEFKEMKMADFKRLADEECKEKKDCL